MYDHSFGFIMLSWIVLNEKVESMLLKCWICPLLTLI